MPINTPRVIWTQMENMDHNDNVSQTAKVYLSGLQDISISTKSYDNVAPI